MASTTLDPDRGRAVAVELRAFGVQGILLTAAEQGRITDVACQMEKCLCPEELGGRGYFEQVIPELPDWMPTVDHFPTLKEHGGRRTVDNVRLAHRLCNRVDYSRRIGRPHARDLRRVEASRAAAGDMPTETTNVWTVLVWNMGMGSAPRRDPVRNWDRLSQLMRDASVDVALLNEVSTDILADVDDAIYEISGTRGRDRRQRDWCTAIFSPHGCTEIRDAKAESYRGRRRNVRFENSRPGSWIAGVVPVPGVGDVTCVSVYGLMDELSEASVHRALSDISPLFSDPRYKEPLLLGGDLNTSTQWPKGTHLDGDVALLQRIEAYGLFDCLRAKRKADTPHCGCTLKECTHTWTRLEPKRPLLQVDYLFASGSLEGRLTSCVALSPEDWSGHSDHAPIIATFGRSRATRVGRKGHRQHAATSAE